MRLTDELARKAATQHGLLNRRQLLEAGVGRSSVSRWTRKGLLVPIRRGVYSVRGVPASWARDLMSACLASNVPTVASHRSALRLWGLRTVDDELEVTIRYPHAAEVTGVIVHRSCDLERADRTWLDGIPTTTAPRTLIDAGLVFPPNEIRRLVAQALVVKITSRAELWGMRERVGRQGRNGISSLVAALESLPDEAGAESGAELQLRALLHQADVESPVPQYDVSAGGRRFRMDMAYPRQRVAIEYDGFEAHTTREAFERDRRRQNALELAGWLILRFSSADLTQRPERVVAEVRRALDRVL